MRNFVATCVSSLNPKISTVLTLWLRKHFSIRNIPKYSDSNLTGPKDLHPLEGVDLQIGENIFSFSVYCTP